MAAFLLDAFVFLEVAAITASLMWIARTADSPALRVILPMIAPLLLVAAVIGLDRVKGDGDGLYVIGLIPFALLVLFPIAALSFTIAAWFWSRKRIEHLREQDGSHRS